VLFIGNTLEEPREHSENLMGTHWELEKDHVGNKRKNEKNSSPNPHPKLF